MLQNPVKIYYKMTLQRKLNNIIHSVVNHIHISLKFQVWLSPDCYGLSNAVPTFKWKLHVSSTLEKVWDLLCQCGCVTSALSSFIIHCHMLTSIIKEFLNDN